MKRINILTAVICLLLLAACKGRSTRTVLTDAQDIDMHYSSLLTLQQGNGFVLAQVSNPWDSTRLLHSYVLVPAGQDLPGNLPQGTVVRTPITRGVFYTSVHTSLINQLGAYKSIAGVCDSEYMYLEQIQQDLKNGRITDCGNSMTPNIEKIIDLMPDAILLSPFENSGSYGKLGGLGIPIIECADYMETSPLGRAEWMRFYGLLTGTQSTADSLFRVVECNYNALREKVSENSSKPSVIVEKKFGDAWYIAGSNSTVGQLLAHAGADYVFASEPASGSVPYDPELVFDRGHEAQIWLIKYNQDVPLTYRQLEQEWSAYAHIRAFKDKQVYVCNTQQSGFYEESPFHPDLLLGDYIKIFHPEINTDGALHYYSRMTE